MKLSKNSLCLCGSGKKFKICCMNKEDDPNIKNSDRLVGNINQAIRDCKIKKCIYPDTNSCSKSIINSHSIQNNRILNNISVDGHVLMFVPNYKNNISEIRPVSKNKATTFNGFCKYHDDVVFKDIETKEFVGENKQIFLFAYRAFAFEHHRKLEATQMLKNTFAKIPKSSSECKVFLSAYKSHTLTIQDNLFIKHIFDDSIRCNKFDILESIIWNLDYKIDFSTTTMFPLQYDLKGILLNDIESCTPMKKIFLSVFPQNNKSYIILSWLKQDNDTYINLKKQLKELKIEEVFTFFNNLIVNNTENIVISPRLWNNWTSVQQKSFESKFQLNYNIIDPSNQNLLSTTNYNLFDKNK